MRHIVGIVILTFSFFALDAQDGDMIFSLKEAQEYALQNNKTLINANKDLLIADEQIKEAVGNGLPQVSGSVDYMTNFNYEFEFNLSGSSSIDAGLIAQAMQQTMTNYPNWTADDILDYQASQAFEAMMQDLVPPATITMEDQASANLQISQLLFSGQYWMGIQMAKLGKKIAEKSVSSTELDVRENVANSYFLALVTEKMVQILEGNKNNLEEIMKHTSDMYRLGMAEETDVDQLKVQLSLLENSKQAMERNLKLNYNMFRFFMGMKSDTEFKLKDNLDSFIAAINANELLGTNMSIENNPTYQILEVQEEIGQKTVDLQKWSYAPTLAGYYSYKEKLMTTAFDLSPKNAAGLSLSVPIFAGGTKKAQLSKAKIELDKINRNKELVKEQLLMQEDQLTFDLKSAYENYKTQKENVDVAKRLNDKLKQKYTQGLVSSLDLTQANSNYLQAESNFVSATLNLLQAKLKLDKLYNKL
ncbi:MAG: TolC family protein [Bacteroidales bacterium]|nr:TolC family protein [Bacteroidales bacterium]MBN2818949.1 TolC family protein [Bacteroidales bacterium]